MPGRDNRRLTTLVSSAEATLELGAETASALELGAVKSASSQLDSELIELRPSGLESDGFYVIRCRRK